MRERLKTYKVEGGSVQVGVLLAQHAGVDVLEDLIEPKLADSLQRIADGGRAPAEEEIFGAALLECHFEAVAEALVLFLVDLAREENQPGVQKVVAELEFQVTCNLHLTRSRGVTMVWVMPQERSPPRPQ